MPQLTEKIDKILAFVVLALLGAAILVHGVQNTDLPDEKATNSPSETEKSTDRTSFPSFTVDTEPNVQNTEQDYTAKSINVSEEPNPDEEPAEQSTQQPTSPTLLASQSRSASIQKAGKASTFSYTNIQANTPYSIDLGSESFEHLAILWKQNKQTTIKYSLSATPDATPQNDIPIADDILSSEEYIPSDLLDRGGEKNRYFNFISDLDISEIRIDLIDPTTTEALTVATATKSLTKTNENRNSGASYSSFDIVTRDEWGANTPSWDPYNHSDIDNTGRLYYMPYYHPKSRITVHHTATANNPADPAAVVRSIYLYHTYSRDWGDIGYNFLIDQNGKIYEGKVGGDEAYGYHAYTEANAMTIGISVIGDFSYVNPSSAAQDSLKKFMAEKAVFYGFNLKYSDGSLSKWLDSSHTVFGHGGTWRWSGSSWVINATACPGSRLSSLLSSSIVPKAQSYKNSNFGTLKSVVNLVHNEIASPHMEDQMVVVFDLPETATEQEVMALIPWHSGITEVIVDKNVAYLKVLDWDSGGTYVPPPGWDGWNGPNTFFPPANGSDDRLKTLLKIFRMDSKVKSAELIHQRELF